MPRREPPRGYRYVLGDDRLSRQRNSMVATGCLGRTNSSFTRSSAVFVPPTRLRTQQNSIPPHRSPTDPHHYRTHRLDDRPTALNCAALQLVGEPTPLRDALIHDTSVIAPQERYAVNAVFDDRES